MTLALSQAAALRLALDCIDSEIKRLNFDANCYERLHLGAGYYAERAYKKRQRLRDARQVLAGITPNDSRKK